MLGIKSLTLFSCFFKKPNFCYEVQLAAIFWNDRPRTVSKWIWSHVKFAFNYKKIQIKNILFKQVYKTREIFSDADIFYNFVTIRYLKK